MKCHYFCQVALGPFEKVARLKGLQLVHTQLVKSEGSLNSGAELSQVGDSFSPPPQPLIHQFPNS